MAEFYYEGKAFQSLAFAPEHETVKEFRGADALAEAEAWYDQYLKSSEINAVYLYQFNAEGERLLIKHYSSVYDDGLYDIEDEWDPVEEEWEDEYDDAY
jgi:hypothetical protein